MKLCVPIPCFFGGDFCDAIRRVSAIGYHTVETYQWKSLDFDAVRAVLEECGTRLVSICTTEFRMTDPAYRDAWLAGLRESCEAAKALGVRKMITQVGPDTGAERGYQHEAITATLRAALPILEDSGVTVMLEPLNDLVDHKGYYLVRSAEAFDIVREVGSPFVKIVYDIYHQQVSEGNIIPSVTGNLDCIAHLHAAGHPGRCDLQYGENDYHVIFDAIDKAGYTGACGLEYRPKGDPEQSLAEALRLYGKN